MSKFGLKSDKPKHCNISITRAVLNENYERAEAYLKRGDTIPYTFFSDCFTFGKLEPIVWGISKNASVSDCGYENLFMMIWENKEEQEQAKILYTKYLKKKGEEPIPGDAFIELADLMNIQIRNQMKSLQKARNDDKVKIINEIQESFLMGERALEVTKENQKILGELRGKHSQRFYVLKDHMKLNKEEYSLILESLDTSVKKQISEKAVVSIKDFWSKRFSAKEVLEIYEGEEEKSKSKVKP